MKCFRSFMYFFGFFALVAFGHAEVLLLDTADESAKKFSTNASMMGVRSTLVIYTFHEQKAALQLVIDNKNTKFPVSGTVYQFASDTTAEALEKWQNNQHSDALFIDAAKPTGQVPLPADAVEIISHKLMGKKQSRNGEFGDYEVEFKISEFKQDGKFQLKEFADKARVSVLLKAS